MKSIARPSGEKTRCDGQWTEARYKSFIKSALRSAQRRWAPLNEVKKAARVSRGLYLCNMCKETVPPTIKDGRKRVKNIAVDHISPIINPETGFTTWDECIENMFCERDNLQLLCKACHDKKSAEERGIAAEARRKRKEKESSND